MDWKDEEWVHQQKCFGARVWYSRIDTKLFVAYMFRDSKKFAEAAHSLALLDASLRAEAFRLDPTGYESEEDLTGLDD